MNKTTLFVSVLVVLLAFGCVGQTPAGPTGTGVVMNTTLSSNRITQNGRTAITVVVENNYEDTLTNLVGYLNGIITPDLEVSPGSPPNYTSSTFNVAPNTRVRIGWTITATTNAIKGSSYKPYVTICYDYLTKAYNDFAVTLEETTTITPDKGSTSGPVAVSFVGLETSFPKWAQTSVYPTLSISNVGPGKIQGIVSGNITSVTINIPAPDGKSAAPEYTLNTSSIPSNLGITCSGDADNGWTCTGTNIETWEGKLDIPFVINLNANNINRDFSKRLSAEVRYRYCMNSQQLVFYVTGR
ncbi:MAG: hypothetical protein OH319_03775 [Candidatus Parvarchaeota archaeon]|nr:hypothetical protein [Candidatus Jingweiarchaeum tengchongense]MCW1298600.1 hypothetical protein [Candidatus Jingweiarchaeum tengchongense]MCW1300446.1 hypothetical protein [Candidatus Jingweiarchaeum tengchongense]MCW1304624.1 hypothetical protein [Candidatus Jingweiarchaeum tengchongense]MCW1305998.1 hypothetical protein [Candidatus Jingweiarchaeum tengchongense]